MICAILRLVGAAVTVGACGFAGLAVADSYRARERDLASWITALSALETEISYGSNRLAAAMRRAGAAAGGAAGRGLCRAAVLLEEGGTGSAGECLRVALEEDGQVDGAEDLAALGQALGASSARDQCRHIALASQRIERRRLAAEEAARRNCRLWSAMGFLIGGMVVLAVL
ncbi:MAG: hypothetical protein VB144_04305 [Clostridia bacterium]|nr:hypothetical protein [Clostridia bacterium]